MPRHELRGDRGQGYVLSQVDLHERMVLATNKAFSAAGELVTANREWHERILHTGGPLFSGPIQPPMMGAAIDRPSPFVRIEAAQEQLAVNIQAVWTAEGADFRSCDAPTPIFFISAAFPR